MKRVALITGGSSGIGAASVVAFEAAGYRTIIVDRKRPTCKHKHFILADACFEADVESAAREAVRKFGPIDVLFLNHGVGSNLDVEEGRKIVGQKSTDVDIQDFRRVMTNNLEGVVTFVKHALPHMPASERSCILVSASVWAYGRLHGAPAYTASKAALLALSRSWAFEFAPIRSVALTLGAVDTAMFRANPNGRKEAEKGSLLRRPISPKEVASTVVHIAGNPGINATDIVIDGGFFDR